jgi:hypothetical protein
MALLLAGLVVTGASWFAAWGRFGLATELSFFPLWLGYVLTVNGLAQLAFGRSLMTAMGRSFGVLFAISVPLWWFFEGMNAIVGNWHYEFARPISTLDYVVRASIDFSTVVPAVLSTSYLVDLMLQGRFPPPSSRGDVFRPALAWAVLGGLACYALLPAFPNETFPLVWIAPILILEPLGFALRFPTLLSDIRERGWRLTAAVMIATTVTGFWWEMWNFHSLPKWTYTIPYVGFWKVFEMPLLGYLGYPFFGIAVFGYAAFVLRLIARQNLRRIFSRARS